MPVDLTTGIENVNVDPPDSVDDPVLTPRGWWTKADSGRVESHATGLEASLRYLRDYLAREHFDVRLPTSPLPRSRLTPERSRLSLVSGPQLHFVLVHVLIFFQPRSGDVAYSLHNGQVLTEQAQGSLTYREI